MRISILIFIASVIIFLLPYYARAQFETDADSVQKKILNLVDEEKYDEVIAYGEKALKNGFDIYAVRNSLGKAYYKRKNYFKAIPDFERAAKLSYNDPENSLFLYKAYDKTGRTEDKNYVYYQLPKSLKNKLKPLENSLADDVNFVLGNVFSNDISVNGGAKISGADNFYGEQILNGNVFYFKIGIHQIPLKWIRIEYEYSYYNHKNKKEIEYKNQKITDDYSRSENRFYNKFDFRVKNGLILSPAAHYIGTNDNTIYANTDSIFSYDTLSGASISRKEIFDDNFIISIEGKKFYKNMVGGINGSFSYLNHDHQTQAGAFIKYYIYPDARLYAGLNATLHFQEATRIIVEPYLGGKVDDRIAGNIFLTFGTMVNFNNLNAYQVFNNGDKIKFRIGANFDYKISSNLHAFLAYNYQYREKRFTTSMLDSQHDYQKTNGEMKYDVNDFSVGGNFSF